MSTSDAMNISDPVATNDPMDTSEPGASLLAATPPPVPVTNPETYNYIVTAQRPTVVTEAVVGNFRNTNDLDLILARVDRLDYYMITAEGLKAFREILVFGRIATLNVFRPPGTDLDCIIVLTVKHHLAIVSFDKDGTPKLRSSGSVADRVGRPAETGFITAVHSSGLIALRLYDGFLKLVRCSIDKDKKEDWNAFSVRFEHNNVTGLDFIDSDIPTIVYFHEDQHGKYVKICRIDLEKEKLLPPHESTDGVEHAATLLIPVRKPLGGIIIVGQESITYQNGDLRKPVTPAQTYLPHYTCYARVGNDGQRFLLGDSSGQLLMLILIAENDVVSNLQVVGGYQVEKAKYEVEDLSYDISIPECLVYLDNSVVFLGSRFGDSQLIRLKSELVNGSFVEILDTISNIGPIRDFIIMTKDNQPQMITCSGCYKNGSLRIIRNGVGIESLATINVSAIKNIFVLRVNSNWDNYFVVSLMYETIVIEIRDTEFLAITMNGFETTKRTLLAGNFERDRIVQVTTSDISFFSIDGCFYTKWSVTAGERLTLCASNLETGQLIVASSNNKIYYLVIVGDEICLMDTYKCANEIACLDISALAPGEPAKIFAAAFWETHEVTLFSINPKIEPCNTECIGPILPRSILIIKMGVALYVMVATGDGTLHYIRLDETTGNFMEKKTLALGTMPAELQKFTWKDSMNVFFCCDRPVIISSVNQRLAFYSVNTKATMKVASLNTETFKNCLMMWNGETITIGTIDHLQKLHIRTVPLYQTVSRIAFQPETNTIAILTSRDENILKHNRQRIDPCISTMAAAKVSSCSSRSSIEPLNALTMLGSASDRPLTSANADNVVDTVEVHSICVLDANTFDCLYVYDLAANEFGLSLCSVKMGVDTMPYYVVGTAQINGEEKEPKVGRIIVLHIQPGSGTDMGRMRIVHEKETRGAVYAVMTLANKLICTINSSVRLFEWTAERELRLECSHFNHVAALYLKTKGDLALVGDLMRSLCLVSYKADDSSFVEIARDYGIQWVSACEIVNSDTFIGAENNYNIFCCKKNNEASSEEDQTILKQNGLFHLGQMINVFRRGTIITNEPEKSVQHLAESNAITYGTSDGGLGIIVQIPAKLYSFLFEIQRRASGAAESVIGVKHSDYRNFCIDRTVEKWSGFMDGDLIESLSEMPVSNLKKILQHVLMPASLDITDLWSINNEQVLSTPEAVLKFVEDISRIH